MNLIDTQTRVYLNVYQCIQKNITLPACCEWCATGRIRGSGQCIAHMSLCILGTHKHTHTHVTMPGTSRIYALCRSVCGLRFGGRRKFSSVRTNRGVRRVCDMHALCATVQCWRSYSTGSLQVKPHTGVQHTNETHARTIVRTPEPTVSEIHITTIPYLA